MREIRYGFLSSVKEKVAPVASYIDGGIFMSANLL